MLVSQGEELPANKNHITRQHQHFLSSRHRIVVPPRGYFCKRPFKCHLPKATPPPNRLRPGSLAPCACISCSRLYTLIGMHRPFVPAPVCEHFETLLLVPLGA